MTVEKPWRCSPLGELTENFDAWRVPVKEADRKPGPYPYYGASGIVDRIDSFIFDGDYLLVAEDGENLRTRKSPIAFMASGRFWVNNHAHIVRGNDQADTRFLMYALSQADVHAYLTGSTMPKLTQGNLNRIPIYHPDVPEQRAIAHILGTLDDKIELNRQMNATLEEMARALFTSWFVDFDPVHAKAAGRQPFGMDAETAALFPDSFEQSELGEIPRGWKVGSVGDLVTIVREGIKPSDYPDEEFDHYSIPAFDEGRIPKRDLGCTIKSNKYLVSPTAVLLSKLNPRFPRAWMPNVSTARRSICSTEFLVAEPGKSVSREYVYSLFQSEPFLDRFASLVTGTSGSHQRVKPRDLVNMRVIRPDGDALCAFTSIVENLSLRAAANVVESTHLAAARDILLPKMLAGRV